MNSSAQSPVVHSAMRVVCFGDSVTGPQPRERYLDRFIKYSDLLQLLLQARLDRAEVLNRGWSGQTSSEALLRVKQDVVDESPRWATVLIGANDAAPDRKVTSQQTRENLRAILSTIQSAGIDVLVLSYHLLAYRPEETWSHCMNNNGIIVEVAAELSVPLLEMQPIMLRAAEQVGSAELVAPDGIHLHPGGELVYAKVIFDKAIELNWI